MSIWLDAERRGLTGSGKSVSIFGPGKWEVKNRVHCPQLAEACRMFNEGSQITVYDSNPEVLEASSRIDHRLSQAFIQETFARNDQLARSENFQRVRAQLSSAEEPSCSITRRLFRMGKDRPDVKGKDDVIIATFSLMYPMMDLAKSDETGRQRIEFLSQYLAQLKPGGAMYVERDCVDALLGDFQTMQSAMRGNKAAQEALKTLTNDKNQLRRLEGLLGEQQTKVKIHKLRQSLGMKGLSVQGVRQATNRVTQTGDVFVFVRK